MSFIESAACRTLALESCAPRSNCCSRPGQSFGSILRRHRLQFAELSVQPAFRCSHSRRSPNETSGSGLTRALSAASTWTRCLGWCPFARTVESAPYGGNMGDCLASGDGPAYPQRTCSAGRGAAITGRVRLCDMGGARPCRQSRRRRLGSSPCLLASEPSGDW